MFFLPYGHKVGTPIRFKIVARKLVLVYDRQTLLSLTLVAALRVNFRLGTAQVYLSTIHFSLLHILNQMLGNCLVLKSNKSKPSTCVSRGLLNNLDFLYKAILAEKPTQLFLSQVVINSTNKHLVPRTTA